MGNRQSTRLKWCAMFSHKIDESQGIIFTRVSGAPTSVSIIDHIQKVMSDPDFDPRQRSFYYVRVIEIPTPKWIAYDAKVFGVELPKGADKYELTVAGLAFNTTEHNPFAHVLLQEDINQNHRDDRHSHGSHQQVRG